MAAGVAALSGDLDLTETVAVALDGKHYVVDLTTDEAKELRKSLQPFIAAARVLAQQPDESIMLGNWETEYEGHIGYAVPEFGDGVTALEWRDVHTPRDQVLVDDPGGFGLTESTRSLADAIGWRVACLCGGLGEPLGDDWVGPLVRRTRRRSEASSEIQYVSDQRMLNPPRAVLATLREVWWRHHGRRASLVEEWEILQAGLCAHERRVAELLRLLEVEASDLTSITTRVRLGN